MKISENSIPLLRKIINGDSKYTSYQSVVDIIQFFDRFVIDPIPDENYTREAYTLINLRKINGTEKMKDIIEDIVDPRRFEYLSQSAAIEKINDFLKYDDYVLVERGLFYKVERIPQELNDIPDLIQRLAYLKDKGVLTEKEFLDKKTDLLAKVHPRLIKYTTL